MFGIWGTVAGIILILIGGGLIFFFPSAGDYQPDEMSILMVVIGFVTVIIGAIMIFV